MKATASWCQYQSTEMDGVCIARWQPRPQLQEDGGNYDKSKIENNMILLRNYSPKGEHSLPLKAVFFFFPFIYLFLLYNTVFVLPYIDMNPPQVYMSSQSWTPLPPPSPYHLFGSSQCTSPKHPVSCMEPRLAIRFLHDSIHVSVPFSQIIPSSPSPTESKSLFYTSVSLLLSWMQGYHYHLFKFHIYVLVYCIGVFLSGLLHSV